VLLEGKGYGGYRESLWLCLVMDESSLNQPLVILHVDFFWFLYLSFTLFLKRNICELERMPLICGKDDITLLPFSLLLLGKNLCFFL